jgi:hypothetical protein
MIKHPFIDKVQVRPDHVTLIISKQNPKTMCIINILLIVNVVRYGVCKYVLSLTYKLSFT